MSRKLIVQGVPVVFLVASLIAMSFVGLSAQAANTHSIDLESGSSQYLSIADGSQTGLDLSGNFTFEGWIKLESQPATDSQYAIIGKWASGSGAYGWHYADMGGTKTLRLDLFDNGDGTNNVAFTASHSLTTGVWTHLAVTYNASSNTATFYVNGSSVGTSNGSGTVDSLFNSSGDFEIGSYQTLRFFDGLIDDVRVWNVVRTVTEIADDKSRELFGNETGLVGYWKLNNSLSDQTANANNLTNNGSATHSGDTAFSGFVETLKVRKTVNESVTNSTVLQNDNQLALSLATDKSYIIDGVIFASSTSGTPDIILGFFGQTDFEVTIGYTNDVNEAVLASGATSTRVVLPANTPTSIHIKGTVKTGATSGDFILKWAQATSNAAPTTVMKGSYLRADAI